jgi:drug/metabolite transporter (DMT)-like permease
MTWFVYATIAAFLTSLGAIVEKRKLEHIHSMDLVLIQSVLAACITAPVLIIGDHRPTLLVTGIAYIVSLFITLALYDVTRGMRHLEISESASLFLMSPLFTLVLGFIFLHEAISRVQFSGVMCLMIGMYILETTHLSQLHEFVQHFVKNQYTRLVLLGVFLYGITAILDRVSLGYLGAQPIDYLALVQIFLAVNFSIFYYLHQGSVLRIREIMTQNWRSMVLLAGITTGQRLMFAEATKLASAGLVVTVKRSSSLFTTVIGGELLHDHALVRKSVACTVMILGVLLISGAV